MPHHQELSPIVSVSRRAYKFRLVTTPSQQQRLLWTLDRCRELYNAALQERKDAYHMAHKTLNYYHQANQLPAVKEARPEYTQVHSQVLQDVLRRVDKTFQAFFRRVKAGETPGYPRYKGAGWYDTFTYPQKGWSLHNDRLTLSKIGTVKVRLHRPVCGKVKTVSIKREGEHWYVCFSVEVVDAALPHSDKVVGIDLGLASLATLSTGEKIDNPRHLRKSLHTLATHQQALSRRKRGSHRRAKAKRAVARIHRRIRNQRADFLHKQSRKLVNEYGTMVFERLQPRNMVRNHSLALSISDAGWGQFVQYCSYKAASADRRIMFVDPRYTSQTCSDCGAIRRKELSERWHSCRCGCELDRDHNAALNIQHLWLGRSQQAACAACRSPRL
jgi:putative transposase